MSRNIERFSDPIRSMPDFLATEQTVPANTNVDGNGGAQLIGNLQGALEVEVASAADMTLAATKTFTAKLLGSETADGEYTDITSASITAASASSTLVVSGDPILRLSVPSEAPLGADTFKWVKINFATDDAAATGKISAYPAYLGR